MGKLKRTDEIKRMSKHNLIRYVEELHTELVDLQQELEVANRMGRSIGSGLKDEM